MQLFGNYHKFSALQQTSSFPSSYSNNVLKRRQMTLVSAASLGDGFSLSSISHAVMWIMEFTRVAWHDLVCRPQVLQCCNPPAFFNAGKSSISQWVVIWNSVRDRFYLPVLRLCRKHLKMRGTCYFTHETFMCSTYSKLFSVQRPVVTLHWLQQHFLRPMPMAVEEPELPYLWQLPCIWEPAWEQKAHITENEGIYQLHNSLWHPNAHKGARASVSEYWAPILSNFLFCVSSVQRAVKFEM